MNISRASKGFLFYKEADGASPNTLASYGRNLDRFARFCATLDVHQVAEVEPDHIRRYLYDLRANGHLAAKTVKNHWVTLSSFWTWATDTLNVPHIVRKVPCPKAPPPEIIPLTKDEIVALLEATDHAKRYKTTRRRAVKRKRIEASRDKAIILLLVDTGLRVTEMCNLTRADVDLSAGSIFVSKAKHRMGTKSRHVYFGTAARSTLFEYLADREEALGHEIAPEAPLIAAKNWRTPLDRHAVRRLLYRCADRAGIKGVYPHRFRHTFAVSYLRNGGDPFTLQKFLGHSSLDMVKVYINLAREDLAKMHKRASPADNWHL